VSLLGFRDEIAFLLVELLVPIAFGVTGGTTFLPIPAAWPTSSMVVAKTVMLAGRRYIVCRDRQDAAKDAADRASIAGAPARQGRQGAGRQRRLSASPQDGWR
jgi:hypothetical protein